MKAGTEVIETTRTTARDDRTLAIYEAVCRHPGCTTRDIADALGLPFDAVKADLEYLASGTSVYGRGKNMDGAPLIECRGGRWYRNDHGKSYADGKTLPGIKVFSSGPEGGRVDKRRHRA